MNQFLTCTAVGLFLSLSPALAEPQLPSDDAQTPPAVNQPSQIPEVMPDAAQPSDPAASAQPSDPAAPIPGDSIAGDAGADAAGRHRGAPGAVVAGSAIH